MRILSVNTHHPDKKYAPHFSSCVKIYNPKRVTNLDIFAKDRVRTTSGPFRQDHDWDNLLRYIFWNFEGERKVNISSLACADGSEPLSYALYLYDKTPKNYYAKFRITASDIDPEMVKVAKSGRINLSDGDFKNIEKYIKNPHRYFNDLDKPVKITNNIDSDRYSYKIDSDVHSLIQFKKSDILTEVKKLTPEEFYVLNIKNVFPYLKENYINEVLEIMAKKLKSGSIFVYGKFDLLVPNFKNRLLDLGFFEPKQSECFIQKI